jgi:hypothetical protein
MPVVVLRTDPALRADLEHVPVGDCADRPRRTVREHDDRCSQRLRQPRNTERCRQMYGSAIG